MIAVGTSYDLVFEVMEITPGMFDVGIEWGYLYIEGRPSVNDFVRYKLTATEVGSATISNPNGIPVQIPQFSIDLQDLDSYASGDHTEVYGIIGHSSASNVGSDLEAAGFVSGSPSGFSFYRLKKTAVGDPLDWVDEQRTNTDNPARQLTAIYSDFISSEFIFGLTGSDSNYNYSANFVSASANEPACIGVDSDDDGVSNYLDLDSDNDGIYDAIESGSSHAQTGGALNGGVDSDGIPLAVSDGVSGVNYVYLNTDSDSKLNVCDSDSDGDGCSDVIESGFPDADGDAQLGGVVPPTVDVNGVVTSGGMRWFKPFSVSKITPQYFVTKSFLLRIHS